jgi:hypothetical protein
MKIKIGGRLYWIELADFFMNLYFFIIKIFLENSECNPKKEWMKLLFTKK